MRRLAVISLHTSPLAQPGVGDSGGMNVYVRELVSAIAQAGVACDVYTRAWAPDLPAEVAVEPGVRVVHVPAGPPGPVAKDDLPGLVDAFTAGVLDDLATSGVTAGRDPDRAPVEAIHANYWLSGLVGHALKHELDLPLVTTFHTLARVKAENGDPEPERRDRAEAEVIGCSDAICANGVEEADELRRHYGADAGRIEIVPPGVDHAFFSPGDRLGARAAVAARAPLSAAARRGERPVLLFVGRIQPLKGLDVAVETVAALPHDAELVVVGGPSGAAGGHELNRVRGIVARRGLGARVHFVPPQPHHLLSSYYRAADVVLVPSRSESFGLVALEAAACGTPVVASDVGGLRTLVEHARTGYLVPGRDPLAYAARVAELLDDPAAAAAMGAAAAERARRYTWSVTAARLRRLYADLGARSIVACS